MSTTSRESPLMDAAEFAAMHPGMSLATARREMRKLGAFKRGRQWYLARAVFDEANVRAGQFVVYTQFTNDLQPRGRLAAAS